MPYIEYLIWAYFVIFPIYVALTYKKDRQKAEQNPAYKIVIYRWTMAFLWLATLLVLLTGKVDLSGVNSVLWYGGTSIGFCVVLGLILFVTLLMIGGIFKVKSDPQNDELLLTKLAPFRWVMPERKIELRYFIFGVSTSAGICEEIIFRGFLLGSLLELLGMPVAILLSSLAFGLPHIYQGASGVIKTFLLGVLFACVYWVSESLLLAIVLHIIIDFYSGTLGYIVLSRNNDINKDPSVAAISS